MVLIIVPRIKRARPEVLNLLRHIENLKYDKIRHGYLNAEDTSQQEI